MASGNHTLLAERIVGRLSIASELMLAPLTGEFLIQTEDESIRASWDTSHTGILYSLVFPADRIPDTCLP